MSLGWVRDPQPACDRQDGGGWQGVRQHVPAPAGQQRRDVRRPPHLSAKVFTAVQFCFVVPGIYILAIPPPRNFFKN